MITKKKSKILKKVASYSFQGLIMLALFFAISHFQERNMLSANNFAAPYFSLKKLNMDNHNQPLLRVKLHHYKGRKTLIYFFAPWCRVCKLSMPNLQKIHSNNEVNVIAIALDYKNEHAVREFVVGLDLTMPILLGDHELARNYRVDAFPSYYVLNENLEITARSRGYSTELGMLLRL